MTGHRWTAAQVEVLLRQCPTCGAVPAERCKTTRPPIKHLAEGRFHKARLTPPKRRRR